MPPQQSNRPLDVLDQLFGFGAHESSKSFLLPGRCSDCGAATQPGFPPACGLPFGCGLLFPPPDGMPPVFSLMLANRYAEFLGDTATIEGLRKRFEALIGPVRKTGGVR